MSLILDALRKLEREKDAREPGVLVVGSVPWGERSRARRLWLAAGAAAVVALAVLVGWMLRSPLTAPAPVVAPGAAASTPTSRAAPPAAPAPVLPPAAPALASSAPPPAPPIRIVRPLPGASPSTASAASRPAVTAEPPPPAQPNAQPTEQISAAPAASGPEAAPPAQGAPAVSSSELRLNAISQRDGRPVALINDRLVFEGDSFDGVRVLHIGEAEVEVEVKGERRVLRF